MRQQGLAVHAKSGLAGRAELAAFFLEHMLVPPTFDRSRLSVFQSPQYP